MGDETGGEGKATVPGSYLVHLQGCEIGGSGAHSLQGFSLHRYS